MDKLLNEIRSFLSLLRRQKFRKLNASTLVEVLVASVLIILIFTIASLSLNNVFKSTIKGNTDGIKNELNKLQYLYNHQKIAANYATNFGDWEVAFIKQNGEIRTIVLLQATNSKTQKKISRKLYHEVNK